MIKSKKFLVILAILVMIACIVLPACDVINDILGNNNNGNNGGVAEKDRLATPTVTIDANGLATWNVIPNATGYRYKIDGGYGYYTEERSVQLTDTQSVQVCAVGSDDYNDSYYSESVNYIVSDCTDHIDDDDNGYCDICNMKVIIDLSFIAINDLHGKFMDNDTQVGVDELTTYIKMLYDDPTREEILISSGDMWQGTVESSSNRGALMTEWMNEMSFVSMTLGNHEFDWGVSSIVNNGKNANFPMLAINVTYNGKPIEGVESSVIVQKQGIKIGIIGAIGNCLSSISGEYTDGLSFATGDELTDLVKAESTRLREEEECEIIVYSLHDGNTFSRSQTYANDEDFMTDKGYYYYDTSLSDGYVDLVLEGHTHQSYVVKDKYDVYHMQAGGENRAIGISQFTYNVVTKTKSVSAETVSSSTYSSSMYEGDEVVEKIFNKYFPDENPYTTVLGETTKKVYSGTICDKVAELYYTAGVEKWGKEYEIVLGGGFLSARSPYDLSIGNITYANLFSILPFDNEIVLGSIKGRNLKQKFINSTNSKYHCYYDESIVGEIIDNKTYYIVTDTYTSTYRSNGITEIARYDSGVYARDLLADYLRSGKTF